MPSTGRWGDIQLTSSPNNHPASLNAMVTTHALLHHQREAETKTTARVTPRQQRAPVSSQNSPHAAGLIMGLSTRPLGRPLLVSISQAPESSSVRLPVLPLRCRKHASPVHKMPIAWLATGLNARKAALPPSALSHNFQFPVLRRVHLDEL